MTIELSIVPASPDGNSFEIVPGDITGIPDADRVRFLQEAQEGRYSRLFVFERPSKEKFLIGDLESLQDCSSGVYVLIQTEPLCDNKYQAFVGMTGDYGVMVKYYERQTDTDQTIKQTNRSLTLAECLNEQHKSPPKNMPEWDLAIAIPEYENAASLFSMLFSIFSEAEGFISRKTLKDGVSYDLFRMHNDHHFFILNPKRTHTMNYLSGFLTDPFFYFNLFGLIVSLAQFIHGKLDNRSHPNGKKAKEFEEKYTNHDNRINENIKNKGDNSSIYNVAGDFIVYGDINNNSMLPISKEFLNEKFPRKFNPFRKRSRKPYDDFGE